MKRLVIVAGLAADAGWVAVAAGAVKHYAGPIQQGGNVAFDTKVKHGKTKRVKSFFFYKLKLTCEKARRRRRSRSATRARSSSRSRR